MCHFMSPTNKHFGIAQKKKRKSAKVDKKPSFIIYNAQNQKNY